MSPTQSALLNARLILVMANELGDSALLESCLDAARLAEADKVQALS